MHAHQDPRRLLLLRVRPPRLKASARLQLREHGASHDRGHQVSNAYRGLLCFNINEKVKWLRCLNLDFYPAEGDDWMLFVFREKVQKRFFFLFPQYSAHGRFI